MAFSDIPPYLSWMFIILKNFMGFFLASGTFLRSGWKAGTTRTQNSMVNVEPCLNVCPEGWVRWAGLQSTSDFPLSAWPKPENLNTSWAQLCSFAWACCPLGLQIWPYGRPWAREFTPREPEFSPASLNIEQMVVTNLSFCMPNHHIFFFPHYKDSFELYFHLSTQRELLLLWRTGNRSSSSSSAPLVTVLCLQGAWAM